MSIRRPGLAGLLLIALVSLPLSAQQRGVVLEGGLHSTLLARSDGVFGVMAGPRGAIRSIGGTRLALSLGAGVMDGKSSARGELGVEYILRPRAAKRWGVYLGGGLAGMVGGGHGGYMVAYAGLERSPGLPGGWAVEAGLGGGFRIRAAFHWRKFPAGWRSQ